ncbi:MAG: PIG-L deacetylase family protein [Clostridia bacterium]
MNVLFVVAHPDDEVLGAGATIRKLVDAGNTVDVAVLNTFDVTAYSDTNAHRKRLQSSDRILGVNEVYFGDWEDSQMNTANHREMVQFIEHVMLETKPEVVFTHHPADINSDHYWCFQSVMEAFRIGQRQRYDIEPIKALYLMEVLSSTDWAMNPAVRPFMPNTYEQVTEGQLMMKYEALKAYRGVIRVAPHPRRFDTMKAQAMLRGAESGYLYAEAFECVFSRGM